MLHGAVQRRHGGAGGRDQITIKLGLLSPAVLDRDRTPLRQPTVIAPAWQHATQQLVSFLQDPHHHPNPVPQQRAVGRCMHQRRRHRAVDPHDRSIFHFVMLRAVHHRAVDCLPTRSVDRTDGSLQH
jgi:hypothetical protein